MLTSAKQDEPSGGLPGGMMSGAQQSGCSLAYITAGAGGMYCGSCMHDNTLARALSKLGIDLVLVPTYTPIRTDEENVSLNRFFFGGINVFLQQTVPLFRYLPQSLRNLLDHPGLVRWAAARPSAVSARFLGGMTVSMLQGVRGNQGSEVRRLSAWLQDSLRPQLVLFTNMLIAGCADHLKSVWNVPLLVTLQGDDVFLESLPEPYRSRALHEIRRLVHSIDGFLVHSRYYAQFMQDYFAIPPRKLHIVPLGIDTSGYPSPGEHPLEAGDVGATAGVPSSRGRTIGYLGSAGSGKGPAPIGGRISAIEAPRGHARRAAASRRMAQRRSARLCRSAIPEADARGLRRRVAV